MTIYYLVFPDASSGGIPIRSPRAGEIPEIAEEAVVGQSGVRAYIDEDDVWAKPVSFLTGREPFTRSSLDAARREGEARDREAREAQEAAERQRLIDELLLVHIGPSGGPNHSYRPRT